MSDNFHPEIVLVRPWNPSITPADGLVEDSLGVGYLAASLRKANYKVAIIDAFTLGLDNEQIVDYIGQLNARVVGTSLHSFNDYRHFVEISRILTGRYSHIYQVLGGEHATFFAMEILKENKGLHAVVLGEGERTICDIVNLVMAGKRPISIPGAVVRAPDESINNGGFRQAIQNLDEIPIPEKDIVEIALIKGREVALSLLSGRGCTNRCTFCTAHDYLRSNTGIVWRRRKPKVVVEELEMLVSNYYGRFGVHPMVQFQDVIFLGSSRKSLDWTGSFLIELERRNLHVPFYIMARADAIIAHKKLLPRLAKAGLSSVEVGIESAVPRILDAYNKKNTIRNLKQAIKLLKDNNIFCNACGFIMFDPYMTLDEVKINAQFLRELELSTWDRYTTRLQVFPGTVMREKLIREGIFNKSARLDDVYAYKYKDPKVGNLAEYTYIYNHNIRRLDINIHKARAAITQLKRKNFSLQDFKPLLLMVDNAQDLYYNHFLKLIKVAETGYLQNEFSSQTEEFLSEVSYMQLQFTQLFEIPLYASASSLG